MWGGHRAGCGARWGRAGAGAGVSPAQGGSASRAPLGSAWLGGVAVPGQGALQGDLGRLEPWAGVSRDKCWLLPWDHHNPMELSSLGAQGLGRALGVLVAVAGHEPRSAQVSPGGQEAVPANGI